MTHVTHHTALNIIVDTMRLIRIHTARPWLLLLTCLSTVSCTEINPNFCMNDTDCGSSQICDPVAKGCVAVTSARPKACMTDSECTTNKPICDPVAGRCQRCDGASVSGDAQCAATYPNTPWCAARGACTPCRSDGSGCDRNAPICIAEQTCSACTTDEECSALDATTPQCSPSGACVECNSATDCSSGACDPLPGVCVAQDNALYVSGSSGTDSATCGTRGAPCRSLTHDNGALGKVTAQRTLVVLTADAHAEAIVVNQDTLAHNQVTIAGHSANNRVTLLTPPAHPGVRIAADKQVVLAHVAVQGSSTAGISCDSAALTMLSAQVVDNNAEGVLATHCNLLLRQVNIADNRGTAGILTQRGTLRIEGGAVAGSGPDIAAMNVTDTASDIVGVRFSGGSVTFDGGTTTIEGTRFMHQTPVIMTRNASATLTGNVLSGGLTGTRAIRLVVDDTVLTGCTSKGPALLWRGRLGPPASEIVVKRSRIQDCAWGGLYVEQSNFTIENTLVARTGSNTSAVGGISVNNSDIAVATQQIRHTTIAQVASALTTNASGIACQSATAAAVQFHSNIVFFTAGAPAVEAGCAHEYSLIEGGAPGTGNAARIPLFVDAPADDYRLRADSPGIDSGNPTSMLTEDHTATPRPAGAGFDIGAYEYNP